MFYRDSKTKHILTKEKQKNKNRIHIMLDFSVVKLMTKILISCKIIVS